MEQPLGFVTDSTLVCRLHKSLYGLKQAPWDQYAKIDSFFLSIGFKCCESHHNIYVLHFDGYTLIVSIYVDNLVITGNNHDLILGLKRQLATTFEMTNLGILHFFLGLRVLPLSNGIFISQFKYALDLLKFLKMDDYRTCATLFQSCVKLTREFSSQKVDATLYRQLVGIPIYLTHNGLDISFVVSAISQFMQDPQESHWKVAKKITCYIKGTIHFGIKYSKFKLVG